MRYSHPVMAHAVAEVDLSALLHNLGQVRKCVGINCRILAVVKANAYGHGAAPVASALAAAGVSMLGVAWVQEGIELRKSGVRLPILIMAGATAEEMGAVLSHRLTPVLYDPAQVLALERLARKRNRRVKVHIKIDTGMGRLGVSSKGQVQDLVNALHRSPHLVAEGAMTHMAEDGLEHRAFTQQQLALFQQTLDLFKKEGINIPIRHSANSSMTLDHPEAHFEMVRPGIMLYGYLPSRNLARPVDLKPAMTLKTRILHLKQVSKGTSISYGRTFIAQKESLIVILPVGYADGLPRLLSNKGHVLIHSRRFPIVGRVCMDMTMVDVTGCEDVRVGDEVTLIGCQGQEAIGADEIASQAGTIAYEILCGIGPRVPRVYKN